MISFRLCKELTKVLDTYRDSWIGINRTDVIRVCIIVALRGLKNLDDIDSFFYDDLDMSPDKMDRAKLYEELRNIQ